MSLATDFPWTQTRWIYYADDTFFFIFSNKVFMKSTKGLMLVAELDNLFTFFLKVAHLIKFKVLQT